MSKKLEIETKMTNKSIHKKYQMPNIDCLVDSISKQITRVGNYGTAWLSTLQYAFNQLPLEKDKHCKNIVRGDITGMYIFLTGFYGLTDMPAQLQKTV